MWCSTSISSNNLTFVIEWKDSCMIVKNYGMQIIINRSFVFDSIIGFKLWEGRSMDKKGIRGLNKYSMIWNILMHPIENKTLFRISSMEQQIFKKNRISFMAQQINKIRVSKNLCVMLCWNALTKMLNNFF